MKVGDTHSWKLVVDMDFQGTEVNVTADITEEVLKVNEDGSYTVTEMQENQIVMGGIGDGRYRGSIGDATL